MEEGSGTGVYPYRGHVGEPGERGPSTGNFDNSLNEGSGYGACLYGSCVGGTWRGGSFAGDPICYERKALEWAHLLGTLRDG
jgi:hypothetical protein